jgi:hypothetical protein
MPGHGHVGAVRLRQHRILRSSVEMILPPQDRDVWVRVCMNLAAQLGQGTGVFLGVKRAHVVGAERTQIIIEEKVIPLGWNQALWVSNENANTDVYLWTEVWGQEPPEA